MPEKEKRSKNNKRNNKINNIQRVTRGLWWRLGVARDGVGYERSLIAQTQSNYYCQEGGVGFAPGKQGRAHAKSHEIKLKHLKIFIAYIRARYDVGTHPHTHARWECEQVIADFFGITHTYTHTHTHINKDIKNWLVREGMSYVLRSVRCLAMSAWVTRAKESLMW